MTPVEVLAPFEGLIPVVEATVAVPGGALSPAEELTLSEVGTTTPDEVLAPPEEGLAPPEVGAVALGEMPEIPVEVGPEGDPEAPGALELWLGVDPTYELDPVGVGGLPLPPTLGVSTVT